MRYREGEQRQCVGAGGVADKAVGQRRVQGQSLAPSCQYLERFADHVAIGALWERQKRQRLWDVQIEIGKRSEQLLGTVRADGEQTERLDARGWFVHQVGEQEYEA